MDKSWFGIPSIIIYLLLKVFFQTPLLINQPMGIWDIYGDLPLDPPLGFLVIYVVILNAWLSIPTRERCCFSSALEVNLPLCLIISSNGWYCIWFYHVLYVVPPFLVVKSMTYETKQSRYRFFRCRVLRRFVLVFRPLQCRTSWGLPPAIWQPTSNCPRPARSEVNVNELKYQWDRTGIDT